MSAPPPADAPWADRGWYLAIEYGVLARDRFLKRLPHLRAQGRFKELLEPGGKILYRNLFRASQVKEAWETLTALQPWKDQLTCYLRGEEVSLRDVQEVLWCAGFLQTEGPCRGGSGDGKKTRWAGCPGARVRLSPGEWELGARDPLVEERHAWTFARVDAEGTLVLDRAAIASFVRGRGRGSQCPASPAAAPEALAAAFADVSVRALGWPLVAELDEPLRARLGEALTAEQAFVLRKGEAVEEHAQLELRWRKAGAWLADLAGDGKSKLGTGLVLAPAIEELLAEGIRLRGVRVGEAYTRREGGHYELEQRFVIQSRVHLGPADRPAAFQGYRLETFPRPTPQYDAWVERVAEALR
ncbi:MAG: hypothetical protein AB7N76_23370 [Planctomycetota bacterium]